MNEIKIEKLTVKEEAKVYGGGQRGFSPGGNAGSTTIDNCCCCCACIDISPTTKYIN